ncbi:hypothetical protein TTRE_0000230701 [Trichuris trichiura]|uniref:Uncharacterized protein n=1 Tax=Trichuris trichiura TaxID=36087 RepID=A0A077Z2W4_TRITR|nr:hypothetical protein TTRE_0000230701 [Trichuris trichiura]
MIKGSLRKQISVWRLEIYDFASLFGGMGPDFWQITKLCDRLKNMPTVGKGRRFEAREIAGWLNPTSAYKANLLLGANRRFTDFSLQADIVNIDHSLKYQ